MKKLFIFIIFVLFFITNCTTTNNIQNKQLKEYHYYKIINNEKYLYLCFVGYNVTFSKIEINKCKIKIDKVFSDSESATYKIPVIYNGNFTIILRENNKRYFIIKIRDNI